jgi:hypothetical protein
LWGLEYYNIIHGFTHQLLMKKQNETLMFI